MSDQAATKKSRSRPSQAPSSPPPPKPGKRPAENEGNLSKRSKRKVNSRQSDSQMNLSGTPAVDDSKKQLSLRLWSEDDEITLLKGILDFTATKKMEPSTDMKGFHEFIKDSLQLGASKEQLVNEIRGLKRRFDNFVNKEKEGKELNLSNPYLVEAYELSKKIWGSVKNKTTTANGGNKPPKTAQKQKPSKTDAPSSKKDEMWKPDRAVELDDTIDVLFKEKVSAKLSELLAGLRTANMVDDVVNALLQLVKGAKGKELQEKWREINLENMQIFLKKVELMQEQTKQTWEAMESR